MMQKQLDLAADELRKLAESSARTARSKQGFAKEPAAGFGESAARLEELLKQLKKRRSPEESGSEKCSGLPRQRGAGAQQLEDQIAGATTQEPGQRAAANLEQSLRQRQQNSRERASNNGASSRNRSPREGKGGEKGAAQGGQPPGRSAGSGRAGR